MRAIFILAALVLAATVVSGYGGGCGQGNPCGQRQRARPSCAAQRRCCPRPQRQQCPQQPRCPPPAPQRQCPQQRCPPPRPQRQCPQPQRCPPPPPQRQCPPPQRCPPPPPQRQCPPPPQHPCPPPYRPPPPRPCPRPQPVSQPVCPQQNPCPAPQCAPPPAPSCGSQNSVQGAGQNDCCCKCNSPCRFRRRRRMQGVRTRGVNPRCNSGKLQAIMQSAMSEDPSQSKRIIQKQAQGRLFGKFDVICAQGDFSYIANTNLFCQVSYGSNTCYAFRQL